MRRISGCSSGFSLVELLLVLAIIGILAMVGAPSFQNKSKNAVRGTVETLVATLGEGRQLARTTGQRVNLHVTGSASSNFELALEYMDPTSTTLTKGGGFTFQGLDSALRAHAAIGVGVGQLTSASPDLATLKKTPLVADWEKFLTAKNALFIGEEANAFCFDASGQASGDFFITVSAPQAPANSPFGLVVVTRDNGLHAFVRTTPSDPWRAL